MSDLFKEPWHKDYLKKAEQYERLCAYRESKNYHSDYSASYEFPESVVWLLKKITNYATILSFVFVAIIGVKQYVDGTSNVIAKKDTGEFFEITPARVE